MSQAGRIRCKDEPVVIKIYQKFGPGEFIFQDLHANCSPGVLRKLHFQGILKRMGYQYHDRKSGSKVYHWALTDYGVLLAQRLEARV
jgi:hypothetical protein